MARDRSIAHRVSSLRPSATVEMTEKVRAARAAGRRILSLASGDPNIPTDPRIIAAAHEALQSGNTRYGPVLGDPRLRETLAAHERRRSGASYEEADIIVTPGGKFALLTAHMSIVEKDSEVLVPEPGWVSYGPCIQLCGGTPILLPMLDPLDLTAMETAVTDRTVAVIVNSPVNPTGRVLQQSEIDGLVALADRRNLWIIFDQVYSDLVHEGPFATPQGTRKGRPITFVVDSFSKTFGMTGWRLGYLAAPPQLAKPVSRFMQHSIYWVPGPVQAGDVCGAGAACGAIGGAGGGAEGTADLPRGRSRLPRGISAPTAGSRSAPERYSWDRMRAAGRVLLSLPARRWGGPRLGCALARRTRYRNCAGIGLRQVGQRAPAPYRDGVRGRDRRGAAPDRNRWRSVTRS